MDLFTIGFAICLLSLLLPYCCSLYDELLCQREPSQACLSYAECSQQCPEGENKCKGTLFLQKISYLK